MKVSDLKYKSSKKVHFDLIQKINLTLFGRSSYCHLLILLIIFTFGANQIIEAIDNDIDFSRFTKKEGLSNSHINCITQDSAGFIWIGTNDGLNKFDGYQFIVYKHKPEDSTSLKSSIINSLAVDYEGKLIVGTQDGIAVYNRDQDAFDPFTIKTQKHEVLEQMISHICVDKANNLWLTSPSTGLIFINSKENQFEIIGNQDDTGNKIFISYIFEDYNSKIWICTDNGLYYLDKTKNLIFPDLTINESKIPSKKIITIGEGIENSLLLGTEEGLVEYNTELKELRTFFNDINDINSISNNKIIAIAKTRNEKIWIGTSNGLNLLDYNKAKFTRYFNQLGVESSLYSNRISTIYEDKQGNLWIGNRDGAINLHWNNTKEFKLCRFPVNIDSRGIVTNLFQNIIISIIEDSKGDIWLGTNGGGLTRYNRETEELKTYIKDNSQKNGIGDNVVFTILEDNKNNIWLGNYTSGLGVLDQKTNTFKYFRHDNKDVTSISGNDVRVLLEISDNHILIGTNNNGLNLFDKSREVFHRIKIPSQDDKHELMSNSIKTIVKQSDDLYWIGTVWGLYLFNLETGKFKAYFQDKSKPGSLNDNLINVVHIDLDKKVWIGTNSGLHLYRPDTDNFQIFTQKDGLPSNSINGIMSDDNGNIWLSTNNGLSLLTKPDTAKSELKFTNYDVSSGLQSNEFFPGSFFKSTSGELFFGGNNGFNAFYPEKIKQNLFLPPVYLTNFSIYNKPVSHNIKDSPLTRHISQTKHITLSYKQNVISFEFVALNYVNSNKNHYQYIMEGFHSAWIDNGTEQKATFTNLNPGTYTFRVRGSNDDKIWSNQEASIMITITPPFWKKWWAFVSYNIIIFLVIYSLIKEFTNREKLKSQLKLERVENQKIREVEQIRSQFFTNISHELRTPLTLIINPLEKYAQEEASKGKPDPQFQIMYWNSKRLLFLINQLLDFRKLESGKLKLKVIHGDIVVQIRNIMNTFLLKATQRKIDFSFQSDSIKLMAWYDPEKFDKLLINLISNAFKFTPDEGRIYIRLKITEQNAIQHQPKTIIELQDQEEDVPEQGQNKIYVEVSVQDSGIGIAPENLGNIFDRFYQVNNPNVKFNEGSGIGLALVKEMVELHHGVIRVESQPEKGSTFKVYLPLGRNHFSDEEISDVSVTTVNNIPDYITTWSQSETDHVNMNKTNLPLILIVDDEEDMINYLKVEYLSVFRVISAKNGIEAFDKAIQNLPDLILSDIMMPIMDGITLTKKLKSELKTSHIPIILLTARSIEENVVEGLESGADDYVTKPFSTKILQSRIQNLIDNRKKLRAQFSGDILINLSNITTTSTDKKFMQQALKIVDENLMDPKFDNDFFIREMGMSRSVIYSKLNAITGKTVSEFIRVIRLKTAAQLLLQKGLSIGEVLYKVGFNNRAYFSKCFKEEFGMPASEYVEMHSKIDTEE